MKLSQQASLVWATGVAIFSLFFGAGNVVFPLTLGLESGQMILVALTGLTITAIGGPLLGLFGMVLFEGDPKKFFAQLGSLPAIIAVILIMLMIGPFGAMPRCFTVTYSALKGYFPNISMLTFNVISGLVTLLLIWRRQFVLPLLGFFLSPLLLLSLAVIVLVGLFTPGSLAESTLTNQDALIMGMLTGYGTMDVLSAIFFSVTVWALLSESLKPKKPGDLIPTFSFSSVLAGIMLLGVYFGLSYATAKHHQVLQGAAPDEILATLAVYLLGPKLAIVANIAVALACLTTVMGLCMTIADTIHIECKDTKLYQKLPYKYDGMIFILISIAVIMSNLGFASIMALLLPVVTICYPALIVLTIFNIVYKLTGKEFIKIPVYTTLIGTMLFQVLA